MAGLRHKAGLTISGDTALECQQTTVALSPENSQGHLHLQIGMILHTQYSETQEEPGLTLNICSQHGFGQFTLCILYVKWRRK